LTDTPDARLYEVEEKQIILAGDSAPPPPVQGFDVLEYGF